MMEALGGGLLRLGFIAFPIVTVLYLAWEIRNMWRNSLTTAGSAPPADRALAVLRERYARGEIGRQEYEERRDVLAAPPQR